MDTHEEPREGLENEATPGATSSEDSRRSWIEVLVDPRTLHGLMSCGAGLLVLGLVTWLWAIGVFENKLVVATSLGVANFGLLALGVSGARYSRYQTASRAITMLACAVMPLNLWFYDTQGLITLDQGGHLWVPALVCCALYVIVARALADPVFVHAIVGGVTMTGLLILADHQVGRFWEIIAPSSFMVLLGIACVHAERAFPPQEGKFSRSNFGRAFFNAGQVVMGLGLSVLLVGRVVGRLYESWFSGVDWLTKPEVATQANLKLVAIALVLSAAYTYVYSHFAVQSKRRYLGFAAATLVWAGILVLDLLQVALTLELVMTLVASLGLAANLLNRLTPIASVAQTEEESPQSILTSVQQASATWSGGLNYLTLGLGVAIWGGAHLGFGGFVASGNASLLFVVASLIGGLSCWLSSVDRQQSGATSSAITLLQASVILLWLTTDGVLALLGFEQTVFVLLLQMLVPWGLALVAYVSGEDSRRRRLAVSAETLGSLILLVAFGGLFGVFAGIRIAAGTLSLALLFAAGSASLGLSSRVTGRLLPAVIAAISLCAATWQSFLVLGITEYVFIHSMAFIGLVCLVISSVIRDDHQPANHLAVVTQWTGRLCVSTGGVATLLIALARLLSSEVSWSVLGLMFAQILVGGIAGLLSKESVWRRHFWVLAGVQTFMGLVLYNSLLSLTFWQRGEILLTCLGLIALAVGYLGWSRETDKEDELVSFNLAAGSLLSAVPLTIGMLIQRFDSKIAEWGWGLVHEAGVLAIGLLLLGAGVLCRIRWSTIVGGTTLTVYVVTLIGLIRVPEQLQTTAVYMMIGGGVFFGTAVLLSMYRDRLLAIPDRIQKGEGVFRVLKWR